MITAYTSHILDLQKLRWLIRTSGSTGTLTDAVWECKRVPFGKQFGFKFWCEVEHWTISLIGMSWRNSCIYAARGTHNNVSPSLETIHVIYQEGSECIDFVHSTQQTIIRLLKWTNYIAPHNNGTIIWFLHDKTSKTKHGISGYIHKWQEFFFK